MSRGIVAIASQVVAAVLFFAVRYAWRSVYHQIPMLMATGIAAIATTATIVIVATAVIVATVSAASRRPRRRRPAKQTEFW